MWFKRQSNSKKLEDNRTFDDEIEQTPSKYKDELDCEMIIIKDKERFGRVSTIRMRYLREKFGTEIADRTLARIQKRYQKRNLI